MEVRRYDRFKPCPFCAEDILTAAIKCKHCGSDLAAPPPAPPPAPNIFKRPVPIRTLGILAFAMIAIWYFNNSTKTSIATPSNAAPVQTQTVNVADAQAALASPPAKTPTDADEQASASVTLANVELPSNEKNLIQIVAESQSASKSAENDMQKGGAKNERDKKICSLMKNLTIKDWIGKIKTIDANSDGKGVLGIEIADDIVVTTWNNALSDIADQTLIDPNSSLFQKVSSMKSGQQVQFSGRFFPGGVDGECIEESSITLSGKLRKPEFIFKFSSIS